MEFIKSIPWMKFGSAVMILVAGYLISFWISKLVAQAVKKHFSKHQAMIAKRLVFYILFLVFVISALQQLGFKLSVLLGAAGIFTVAISFASQTAVSNLISGIFLLFDRPFKVGDYITVNGFTGTVDTIDLLSTKITTADNQLVRIPNETMIKSPIINGYYYKKRRVDLIIGVAYHSDLVKVKAILGSIALSQPAILKDPPPQVIIDEFALTAINLRYMVWTNTTEASAVKNQLKELIKIAFDKEGITIPYQQPNSASSLG